MTIRVSLDTSATPPVTVDPRSKDKNKGKDKITWEPAQGQDFTFVSLEFANDPACFSNLDVKDHKITVDDDNSNGAQGIYPYTIVVSQGGQNYSTATTSATDDTTATSGTTAQAFMVATDPVIRNQPI